VRLATTTHDHLERVARSAAKTESGAPPPLSITPSRKPHNRHTSHGFLAKLRFDCRGLR